MTEVQTRKAGRPKTSVLNPDQIVDAAFEVVHEAGPDGFTLTRLAAKLSVKPPALYHYFANKDAVIKAMRGRLASLNDVTGFARGSWDTAIFPWARSYRAAMLAFPASIALLATRPIDGEEESVANYETISASFLAAGWPEHEVVTILVALESFAIGSALDALAPDDNMSPGAFAADAPIFAAAEQARRDHAANRCTSVADASFELGLALMVAGLRMRLAELRA
ncbi:TetR/AcrR family transcriptional regulator C-terminal domain-containing protein [Glaciibacter psychrotolerans]|uniref:AcrR family transcriptional regulator n=1 Tax=Glaciibacter psychrotolerans TaxID=670054 RepID=A0A7Z0J7F2_9MICO|nr:AcrR family transcriptional regulator [Leifsonia psychrotolerans]